MYLYSNDIDPDALTEVNWGEPIKSKTDLIYVIADIIMDNALEGVKDFNVKDGPNGYPEVSIWGKDINDVTYAVNEIWYAGEASDDDMEDIMDLIVQTNKVPKGLMLSGEAFEESKEVKKPLKTKKMKEADEWNEDVMWEVTDLLGEASVALEKARDLYKNTGCRGDAQGCDEALDIIEKISIGEYS